MMLVSIVIRTYNEQRYLGELLEAIAAQVLPELSTEVILVDSGSTDQTLEIAQQYDCRIVHINKADFSFGRSLNLGCAAAKGDVLVFISGHCIPTNRDWLANLVRPIQQQQTVLTYGRQKGGEQTRFSEHQLFQKFYPETSCIPQTGFFCNNANAALLTSVWRTHPFDETLTGLEDMHLAKRLVADGLAIGYVADAIVYHYHEEPWLTVWRRYEREAIALQQIMPEVQLHAGDILRYLVSAWLLDIAAALQQRQLLQSLGEIFLFRLMQFLGSYRGNHNHRQLSHQRKEAYFYPKRF